MTFDCKVNIVDAVMGAGKTESIMNMINNAPEDDKFLVITPYLDEITRYQKSCPSRHFKQPQFKSSSKYEDLKKLINSGANIVSTHALFQKFDNTMISICRAANYTLIMDEVANVVEEYSIVPEDYDLLRSKFTTLNEETKQLIWKPEYANYDGKFNNEKRLCEMGSLVVYGKSLMIWLFPIEAFNAFRNIYILTYLFNMQLQRYYYDYYGLPYTYLSVEGEKYGDYHLVEYDPNKSYIKYDYSKLIHIIEDDKMNLIGDRETDLSKTWYQKSRNTLAMKKLKNNLLNFFRNIRLDKSSDNLWTTFKDFKGELKGKGYTKGFLASNARATNEYRDRTSVAYPINKFINPFVKNFFHTNGIQVDEDGYAMSEMLQFIWRSAIRDGKEIWVYVPSIRMRKLLEYWIVKNKLKEEA